MTAINYVSQKEMAQRTGLKGALGYAFPKEDEILIRKGLSKEKKKEVLAHEEEHIEKGEEGPFWPQLLQAGATVLGGVLSSKSAGKAADAVDDSTAETIGYARETRDLIRSDTAPQREAGYTALDALMRLTGLESPTRSSASTSAAINPDTFSRTETNPKDVRAAYRQFKGREPTDFELKYYNERPNELYNDVIANGPVATTTAWYSKDEQGVPYRGKITPVNERPEYQQQATTPASAVSAVSAAPTESISDMVKADPSYEFRLNEGTRAMDRSAAASGGLLSGGYGRALTRYAQGYASTEYSNIYNRIANIAGYGQTANQQNLSGALAYGSQAGAAAGAAGSTRASAYIAQGNAWTKAIDQAAMINWFPERNAGTARGTAYDDLIWPEK